jgi:hypothetical protein
MIGELRPELSVVSAEAQAFAYEQLTDYESSMREFANLRDKGAIISQYGIDTTLAIMDDLENTDYIYFPVFQGVQFYIGCMLVNNYDQLDRMAYNALLAGYNPPQDLVRLSHDDFLADEILNAEHPEYSYIRSRYGYWGKDNMPDVSSGISRGHIIPRSVLRQVLGTLYDRGAEYRSYGWGYPNWSESLEKQLAEITGGAEAI